MYLPLPRDEEAAGNDLTCRASVPCRIDHHAHPSCSKIWLVLLFIIVASLFFYVPFMHIAPHKPIAFVWPANQSRDASLMVSPNSSTTFLWPRDVCSSSDRKILLLVVVCSALKNFDQRRIIRDSWARDQRVLPNVRVLFLVGQLPNATFLQSNVTEESDAYGDILQEGFVDTYANLTIKSVMLLKWFAKECKHIQYLVKTDDDMYINLKQLFQLVMTNRKPHLLVGSLICGAVPISDPYNKWYCPEYMFDKKVYPNYLSGTAYVMSRSTALALFEAALQVPLFHLEDIYVTGILSEHVGIRPQDHLGFSFIKRKLNSCLYAQTISSHHISETEMTDMYHKLSSTNATRMCPIIKQKNLREYGPGKCKWTKKR